MPNLNATSFGNYYNIGPSCHCTASKHKKMRSTLGEVQFYMDDDDDDIII